MEVHRAGAELPLGLSRDPEDLRVDWFHFVILAMVTRAVKSPTCHKNLQDSFEDKHERRLEYHEILRSRHNVTSCRQDSPNWGREQEKLDKSPRQQEFFKRRHLHLEDSGDKHLKSPPKHQRYIKLSPLKQSLSSKDLKKSQEDSSGNPFSWHHKLSFAGPSDIKTFLPDMWNHSYPCEASLGAIKKEHTSTRERGVQTIHDPPKLCVMRESSQQTDCSVAVLNEELLELSDYLKEALQREQKLKKKLSILQELLNILIQTSEKTWKVQVNEDILKCKVTKLENQLFLYSQNIPKTKVKKILLEMEEQKQRYEEKAVEFLQKLTEDRMDAERHLQSTQMSLVVSGDECELWKEEFEKLKKDWSEVTSENCELRNELHVLQSKLQWVETQDSQLQQIQNRLQSVEIESMDLQSQNDQLQEDNDLQKQQLNSMEVRLRNAEEQKLAMQLKIHDLQKEMLSLSQKTIQSVVPNSKNTPLNHSTDEDPTSEQLHLVTEKLIAKENELSRLKSEMESLAVEYKSCKDTLQLCRENLKGIPKQKLKSRTSCWVPVFVLFVAVLTMVIISSKMEYFSLRP
uniref:TRAF3 interacting protein 3 n=1 Tax=Leptobrachium leishanense TaxID=445787 RepID=A0A8C5P833_9ANUR